TDLSRQILVDRAPGNATGAEPDAVVTDPGDLHPEVLEQGDLRFGVADPRHPVQQHLLLGEQAGGEDRQRRVLVAGDGDLAGEGSTALDYELLHRPARVTTVMGRRLKVGIAVVVALLALLLLNALVSDGETEGAEITEPGGRIFKLPDGDLQLVD